MIREDGTKMTFEEALENLINKYSAEQACDTPDFILAKYMKDCFDAYAHAVNSRDKWFGVDMWSADKISQARKDELNKQ